MKNLIAIVLILIAGNKGLSQDSLAYYMDIAAKENPLILQKYYEYEASLQKVPQAAAIPDPELNAGIFLTPMELVMGNQVAELQLMQMFPWFGTLRAAKDEMSLMANAAYESFRDTKLQVLYDLQTTWYELIRIEQEKLIARKNLEILYSIERLARVRFISGSSNGPSPLPGDRRTPPDESSGQSGMPGMQGDSPDNTGNRKSTPSSGMQESSMGNSGSSTGLADIYNIQIEISDIKNNVALLENRQKSVTARFNAFFNRPALESVFMPDTLVVDTLLKPDIPIPDSLIRNNPMLAMQNYETQSIQARKKMVTRMGFPMVGIGLNYSIINRNEMSVSENGRDMIMPMLSLTLPIYRKKYKAMKAEADLLSKASENQGQMIYNDLSSQYFQAIQQYEDALRRIRLYSDQTSLTRKSLNIMIKDFTTAGSGLTEILRLQQQLLNYDYRHIEAITDFHIAIALLKRISGN
ncbi:MAG TPA: TolC family protein [Bacteroidales bacterium]|nr:TolC family protein [Bacteroidales bacterium]